MKSQKKYTGIIIIILIVIGLVSLFKIFSFKDNSEKRLDIQNPDTLGFPRIDLIIGEEERLILNEGREKAIKRKILLDEYKKKVSAKLRYDGKEINATIKLKGTLSSHWEDSLYWSYRVVIEGQNSILNGLKVFSLQTRGQRGYYIDKYYQTVLNHFNVLNLSCYNVDMYLNNVRLNDPVKGCYAVEEFFDKPVLTRMNRPDGVILKFEYEGFWENPMTGYNAEQVWSFYDEVYTNAPIVTHKFKSEKYDEWDSDCDSAIRLLNSFRKGELAARDVFDIPLLGKFFSINSIFGNQHPSFLFNLRFYYNSQTKLLEPIGYDLERIHGLNTAQSYSENFWPNTGREYVPLFHRQLFQDSLMQMSYMEHLDIISDSGLIDSILRPLESEYQVVYKDNPVFQDDRPIIWFNIKFINEWLATLKKK